MLNHFWAFKLLATHHAVLFWMVEISSSARTSTTLTLKFELCDKE